MRTFFLAIMKVINRKTISMQRHTLTIMERLLRTATVNSHFHDTDGEDTQILKDFKAKIEAFNGKVVNIEKNTLMFQNIDDLEIYDKQRRTFYPNLQYLNRVNSMDWTFHCDEPYYPATWYTDRRGVITGFDYLNFVPEFLESTVSYPGHRDKDGTYETYYSQFEPCLMLRPLINQLGSADIDMVVLFKGMREFNENNIMPLIPKQTPHADDEGDDNHETDDENEESLHDQETHSTSTTNESDQLEGFFMQDDLPTIPTVLDKAALDKKVKRSGAFPRAYNNLNDENSEEMRYYVTGDNLELYMQAVVASEAFRNAVQKPQEKQIRRICVWVLVKAHVLLVVWDTNLNSQHCLYVCNNLPEDAYNYPDDFENKLNDDVLQAFSSTLYSSGYLTQDSNVEFYIDVAFRSYIRDLFLRNPAHKYDLACTAFVMLSLLYLSMVKNAVLDDKISPHIFTSYQNKKWFRFEMICFRDHLKSFLKEKIRKQNLAVWFPPDMKEKICDLSAAHLVTANPRTGEFEKFKYNGCDEGFVQFE